MERIIDRVNSFDSRIVTNYVMIIDLTSEITLKESKSFLQEKDKVLSWILRSNVNLPRIKKITFLISYIRTF